ncbi:tRNA (guanosine(37)-N1)-methyltransferase TrmD [Cohnella fermenti]|uniref:tRNA (guanine-N(1)-)-methyltransferase n=1 Tax=Cohnella fermenti TaxID=2565925 RepID=A0A4V3WFR7_9BACL|nr:tRNA (guanosine(37)-N1)-methyltransferase TrmD [Cohnella fermenti]THF81287.1 tRNA (guanosine(37)-N1)-methyltransferase TrmD [Cohnella fermenti]
MRIDVLTLFPEMFEGVFGSSILGKARDKGIVSLNTVNFRDYANNKHNTVDDTPYGGGGGMVLKAEPIFAAVEDVVRRAESADEVGYAENAGGDGLKEAADEVDCAEMAGEARVATAAPGGVRPQSSKPRVILLCPQGETFTQAKAQELSRERHLIFICGHYEGYDERIREFLVTDELSIGDYVLTGGELPAMVAIDSIVRLLPGVLGNEQSAALDSFSDGLLEYPHYTRPPEFREWKVPDVLLSGHHAEIDKWRRRQSLERTLLRRPDLLEKAELTAKERQWLAERKRELELEREAPSAGDSTNEAGRA